MTYHEKNITARLLGRVCRENEKRGAHIALQIRLDVTGLAPKDAIGKTVFLTREAAEEALKAREI